MAPARRLEDAGARTRPLPTESRMWAAAEEHAAGTAIPRCLAAFEAQAANGRSTKEPPDSLFTRALVRGSRQEDGTVYAGLLEPGFAPYTHQVNAARRMGAEGVRSFCLFHDPGTGKTFTAVLDVCLTSVLQRRQQRVLVSAPNAIVGGQWLRTFVSKTTLEEGTGPGGVLLVTEGKRLTAGALSSAAVVIVSHALVRHAHARDPRGALFTTAFDTLFIDEVHELRSQTTKTAAAHAALLATRRIGLTGTPIVNGPEDLAGICRVLHYPERFCDPTIWKATRQAMNTSLLCELCQGDRRCGVDVTTQAVLNLPPLTIDLEHFDADVPTECVPEYNAMWAEGQKLSAALARGDGSVSGKFFALIQRMQMFVVSPTLARAGAQAVHDDVDVRQDASRDATGSQAALVRTLAQLRDDRTAPGRVIVFCKNTSTLKVARERVLRECGAGGGAFETLVYSGGSSVVDGTNTDRHRAAVVREYLGELCEGVQRVLFVSITAGGTGLDLGGAPATVVFWGGLPYADATVEQAMKRVHRMGQTSPVRVIFLFARGSVDGAMYAMQHDKKRLAKALRSQSGLDALALQHGGKWKQSASIMHECCELAPDGGFAPPRRDRAAGPTGLRGIGSAARRVLAQRGGVHAVPVARLSGPARTIGMCAARATHATLAAAARSIARAATGA